MKNKSMTKTFKQKCIDYGYDIGTFILCDDMNEVEKYEKRNN